MLGLTVFVEGMGKGFLPPSLKLFGSVLLVPDLAEFVAAAASFCFAGS